MGGNIYDRGVDGSQCRWARVLAYEPPNRVVFSWDISPQWQIETDLDKTSEVEVRFIAESPDRTRSNSSTATSTATAPAGKPSATASPPTRAGRSTSTGSPSRSTPEQAQQQHDKADGDKPQRGVQPAKSIGKT